MLGKSQELRSFTCLFSSLQGDCFKNPHTGRGLHTAHDLRGIMHNELISARQGAAADIRAHTVLASADFPRRH